jgi:hypothetical protein
MGDDLVSVEIEVDPFARAASFGAAKHLAVKGAGSVQIMNRKGKVKRGDSRHEEFPVEVDLRSFYY